MNWEKTGPYNLMPEIFSGDSDTKSNKYVMPHFLLSKKYIIRVGNQSFEIDF